MSAAVVLVAALLGAAESAPPEPDVVVAREAGVVRTDASLGGRIVSFALPREGSGRRTIWLLVAPRTTSAAEPHGGKRDTERKEAEAKAKEEPRTLPPCPEPPSSGAGAFELHRLDEHEAKIERVRTDLPQDATALDAIDLDGDGRDELLVFRPSGAWIVPTENTSGALTPLVEAQGLLTRALDPRPGADASSADWLLLAAADLDGLSIYAPAAEGPRWERKAHVELPLGARVDPSGIEVWADVPRGIGSDARGTRFLATPPEASGSSRVRTALVALDAAGQATMTECWGRLPGHEDLIGSGFLFLDDKPVLLVTTKPAGRLDLFGEKLVRIFPLERDRSHLGLAPIFAAESRMNIWQEATPLVYDADGDRREDLVVGYWKGILGDTVVLDVYRRREDGTFETRVRSTELDVKQGDRSFVAYGSDVTGDGLPDLIVRGKPGLLLFPGRPSRGGASLVEERPRVVRFAGEDEIATTEGPLFTEYGGGRPRLADLDGDGVREILLVEPGADEVPGRIHVIRIAPSAD